LVGGLCRRTLLDFARGIFASLAMVLLFTALNTPALARYASIVVDADSGRVLHSANADTRNFPASLTKMMTLYLLFDALEKGTLTLDSKLKVSRRAAGQAPSRLGLKAGSTIAVRDVIGALVIKSANDVATVAAEAMGGTEIKFALMMTKKARDLGMKRTTFRNASGLPNRAQLSTARDMSRLARALIVDFPGQYRAFSEPSFVYGGRTYRTHNNLLKNGADGIKTGYTRASGFNLVTSVERNGHRLIGVVFGGKTARSRDRHMVSLLDRSFKRVRTAPSTAAARPVPKPLMRTRGPQLAQKQASLLIDPLKAPTNATISEPGAWGIQVGAFAKFAQARRAADLAADRLPALNASIEIQAVNARGRTLYRARLMGVTRNDAQSFCGALQQRGNDCALVTPEGAIRTGLRQS
ncbi:MAG: serine hydrolase, partial [Alphaproteobacteria bacterium]